MDYKRGSSGGVIKAIAIIFVIIGLIGSVVIAGQLAYSFGGGFLYFLVLSFSVFLVALVFYGFGELVGNTAETNGLLQAQADELKALKKMLSDRPVVAAPETAGSANVEPKQLSDPIFKDAEPLPVSNKEFFASLMGLDSAKAMLECINEQYPSTNNSAVQCLIKDLQQIADIEGLYGNDTVNARKKLQAFLEKMQ